MVRGKVKKIIFYHASFKLKPRQIVLNLRKFLASFFKDGKTTYGIWKYLQLLIIR